MSESKFLKKYQHFSNLFFHSSYSDSGTVYSTVQYLYVVMLVFFLGKVEMEKLTTGLSPIRPDHFVFLFQGLFQARQRVLFNFFTIYHKHTIVCVDDGKVIDG